MEKKNCETRNDNNQTEIEKTIETVSGKNATDMQPPSFEAEAASEKQQDAENEKSELEPRALSSEADKKKKRRTSIFRILFILVSVGVCVAIFFSEFKDENITGLFGVIKNSPRSAYLYFAALAMLSVILIQTFRMSFIMKYFTNKLHLVHSYRTAAVGKYYDSLTPSAIGGQPSQIYYLYKSGFGGTNSSGMVVVYFLAFQFGYLLTGIVTFATNGGVINFGTLNVMGYLGLAFHAVFPAFLIICTINKKVAFAILHFLVRLGTKIGIIKKDKAQARIDRIENSLNNYADKLSYLFKHFGTLFLPQILYTVVEVVCFASVPYFVVKALGGTNMNWYDALTLYMFVHCASSIIPTPGTTGGAELIFLSVYQTYLTGSPLFWAMVIWRLLTYYLYLIQGLILTLVGNFRQRRSEKTTADGDSHAVANE